MLEVLVLVIIYYICKFIYEGPRTSSSRSRNSKPVSHLVYGKNENGELNIDLRNFIIHTNYDSCENEGHEYERVIAVIPFINKNGIVTEEKIVARHCFTCRAYYISEEIYNHYMAYGHFLCQTVSYNEYKDILNQIRLKNNRYDVASESKFKLFGYNVGKKDAFSDVYRQTVLKYMIEGGLTNNNEAIHFIEFNINNHENKTNMRDAVAKWKRDKAFLGGYTPGYEDLVGVRRMVK